MVLDPISTLSVAAAAVQFVQFSSQIVSKGRHIYNSSHGVAQEHEITETVTLRLQELTQRLSEASIKAKASDETNASDNAHLRPKNQGSGEMHEHYERVHSICKECETLSGILLDRLQKLKVPAGSEHRRWKSFRHALKDVWSKSELDGMSERLRLLREELDSHMLFVLRETMNDMSSDMSNVLRSLDENTRTVISSLDNAQTAQKRELQEHFDQLSSNQRQDYERSRSAFVQDDAEHRKISVQFHILQSLRFAEMSHRVDALTPAHAQTFKWLFQDSQIAEQQRASFQTWLSKGSGLYWVSGKAGSGKSTLLRFIWEQGKTWECLDGWAEGSQIIAGAFYFWNSGVAEQRSHSGFLRSLLYELLKEKSDLIPTVFIDEWEQNCALSSHDKKLASIDWTLSRLQASFRRLVGLATKDLRFCFFIDGLDEYDGYAGDIAEYIASLSSNSSYTKFCVSSRPWPVFETVFRDSHGLRLQDLTKDDIRAYVNDKLGKNKHTQDLKICEPENTSELIEEVVDKAVGVFLWVKLVIKSLIGGLRDGDEISHLRSRLASLPPDLETLYEHMLNRIEPEYRQESAKIFQIFRANNYSLGVRTLNRALSYSDHRQVENIDFNDRPYPLRSGDKVSELRMMRMILRLNSRTKGLLETHETQESGESTRPGQYQPTATCVIRERGQSKHNLNRYSIETLSKERKSMEEKSNGVQPTAITTSESDSRAGASSDGELIDAGSRLKETSWPQDSPYITFIHRTARDYLEKDRVWTRILNETSNIEFNPHLILLTIYVLEAKTTPLISSLQGSRYQIGSQLFRWLGKLQMPVDSPGACALIEDLDRILTFQRFQSIRSTPRDQSQLSNGAESVISDEDLLSDTHWSASNTANPHNLRLRERWGGDILSAAISCRVDWYFMPILKVAACPLLPGRQQDGLLPNEDSKEARELPLLAYALRFHEWADEGSARTPDIEAVGMLLAHGQNPNAIYKRFSLWEYVIHYVHCVHILKEGGPDLVSWLRAFELLLHHGANPHACCIRSRNAFRNAVALPHDGYENPVLATHGHSNIAPHPYVYATASDKPANIVENAHSRYHSVTAVVYNAFVLRSVSGSDALVTLLEEKKKGVPQA